MFSFRQIHVAVGFANTSECKISGKEDFSIISKVKEGRDPVLIVATGRGLKEVEENFLLRCS